MGFVKSTHAVVNNEHACSAGCEHHALFGTHMCVGTGVMQSVKVTRGAHRASPNLPKRGKR